MFCLFVCLFCCCFVVVVLFVFWAVKNGCSLLTVEWKEADRILHVKNNFFFLSSECLCLDKRPINQISAATLAANTLDH